MKLTKEKVCVFIEDEAQLEQARELLVKYGEDIDRVTFCLSINIKSNFLRYCREFQDWGLGEELITTITTITELEKILSDGKED